MKKLALLLVAAAMIGAAAPGYAFAQDASASATTAESDPKEAIDAWNAWNTEKDVAKKVQMGKALITQYPGSKVAENVMGTAFSSYGPGKTYTAEQVTELARAYHDAYAAGGKTGQYQEYALGWIANAETDPNRIVELGELYLQKHPNGNFKQYIEPKIVAARYKMFENAVAAKNYPLATKFANEAKDEFEYAYIAKLTQEAWKDLITNNLNATTLPMASAWADRGIAIVQSGQVPATVKPEDWEKAKPQALNLFNRIKGYVMLLNASKKGEAATSADFEAAIQQLQRALETNDKDILAYYFIGQARNAQYQKHVNRFGQFATPEEQQSPEAQAVLAELNTAADQVIDNYVMVIRLANADPNLKQLKDAVEPTVVELYKYRHEDNPEGWRELVNQGGTSNAAAATAPSATK